MKKLLALVLCVMMFVSVLPTAAFAGGVLPDIDANTVSSYNTQIKNMIKNTKKSVENSYKALAGDQIVYTSAKAMDDTIVALVNNIADPLIAKNKFDKAGADIVKAALRAYFDEAVAKNIDDNLYKAYNDGKFDDLKYAQVVSNAMSKALNDKTFIAGYQAVATYFALATLASDMKDSIKDQYDSFKDSVDAEFEEKFAANYTTLVDEYIDTFATGAAKAAANDALLVVMVETIADAADERDAIVDPATELYDETVADLDEEFAGRDTALKQPVTDAKTALTNAQNELARAEAKAAAGIVIDLKPYEDAVKDAQDDLKDAERDYKENYKDLEEEFAPRYENAYADYIDATFDAEYDYKLAVAAAEAIYAAGYEDVNPWAERVLPTVGSWK